jgi:hypothetical protein
LRTLRERNCRGDQFRHVSGDDAVGMCELSVSSDVSGPLYQSELTIRFTKWNSETANLPNRMYAVKW